MKRILAAGCLVAVLTSSVAGAYAEAFNLGSLTNLFGKAETETVEDKELSDVLTGDTVQTEVNGIKIKVHVKFKELMDSYEAFFNEYVELMKSPSPDLMKYATFMARYAEIVEKLDELDEMEEEDELSEGDLAYYTYVMANISIQMTLIGE